jgi:hypothetical protein
MRRVSAAAAPAGRGQFAGVLRQASFTRAAPVARRPQPLSSPVPVSGPPMTTAPLPTSPALTPGGPAPITCDDILANAQRLLDLPYVWGGTSGRGLDCSAYVSQVWGVSRYTTETLRQVASPISKDELQAGDALNLTTAADPSGYGHVRLFDKWADAAHTRMWVYEETPPRSVHHVVAWDARYTPLRRHNLVDSL